MMCYTIYQCEFITFIGVNSQSGSSMTCLFIGHSYSTHIGGIGVSITGIQKIKTFSCKKQPSLCIKIFGVIFPDLGLEITLPITDYLMEGFGSGSKIVGFVDALLVKIDVDMRHPLVVYF